MLQAPASAPRRKRPSGATQASLSVGSSSAQAMPASTRSTMRGRHRAVGRHGGLQPVGERGRARRPLQHLGVVQQRAAVAGLQAAVGRDPGVEQAGGFERGFEAGALRRRYRVAKVDQLPERRARARRCGRRRRACRAAAARVSTPASRRARSSSSACALRLQRLRRPSSATRRCRQAHGWPAAAPPAEAAAPGLSPSQRRRPSRPAPSALRDRRRGDLQLLAGRRSGGPRLRPGPGPARSTSASACSRRSAAASPSSCRSSRACRRCACSASAARTSAWRRRSSAICSRRPATSARRLGAGRVESAWRQRRPARRHRARQAGIRGVAAARPAARRVRRCPGAARPACVRPAATRCAARAGLLDAALAAAAAPRRPPVVGRLQRLPARRGVLLGAFEAVGVLHRRDRRAASRAARAARVERELGLVVGLLGAALPRPARPPAAPALRCAPGWRCRTRSAPGAARAPAGGSACRHRRGSAGRSARPPWPAPGTPRAGGGLPRAGRAPRPRRRAVPARSGGRASVSAFESAVSSGFFDSCGWRSWISVSISAS